jgi:hypothetical protein
VVLSSSATAPSQELGRWQIALRLVAQRIAMRGLYQVAHLIPNEVWRTDLPLNGAKDVHDLTTSEVPANLRIDLDDFAGCIREVPPKRIYHLQPIAMPPHCCNVGRSGQHRRITTRILRVEATAF